MRSLAQDIGAHGLFIKRAGIHRLGYSDGDITAALTARTIIRVRKGWYSVPSAPPEALVAVRIGGRLTGLSALRTYGIWTPETRKIHVTVPTDARGLHRPNDMHHKFEPGDGTRIRLSWSDDRDDRRPPYVWRTSVVHALVHIVNTHDRVTAIVCLDAALHNRREGGPGIDESDLPGIFARAPHRVHSWQLAVDGRAEAGGETEFRLKALAAGIPFVPQPFVKGVGRLDGQIGPRTFVEIDGKAWHADGGAFEVDCTRDVKVAAKDGRVLRFSYELVRKHWDLCERAMCRVLAADYLQESSTEFPAFSGRIVVPRPGNGKKVRRTQG